GPAPARVSGAGCALQWRGWAHGARRPGPDTRLAYARCPAACRLLGGRRIDHRRHLRHTVGGKATLLRMLANEVLVRRDVDTVDLVAGHVAVQPLHLGAELAEHPA